MDQDFPDPVTAEELSSAPVLDLPTYIHVVRMLCMKRYGSHLALSKLFGPDGARQVRLDEEGGSTGLAGRGREILLPDQSVSVSLSLALSQSDSHLGSWRDCPYVPLAHCPERSVATLFTLNKALLVQLFRHHAQPCKSASGPVRAAGKVITFDGLKALSRQCDLHRYVESC